MPACNNFCTTSSLSSSSHVSHFTAIIFSSKKRKKIMLHFEWERAFISNIYTKDIFAWVGRSFNSIFRSYAKLFLCISFSHFLLAIHPKIFVLFWSFFSLSLSFLILFYVRMYVCYMLNQFHIDDDGRNINKRKKLNDIDSQRFSFYLFFVVSTMKVIERVYKNSLAFFWVQSSH